VLAVSGSKNETAIIKGAFQMKYKSASTLIALVIAFMATPFAIGQTYNFKTIQVPHSQSTSVYGINDSGVMSGNYIDSSGATHCFIVSGATITTITDPNGTSTSCFGINSSGAIVGSYALSTGFSNGFIYQNGIFTDIVVPTATAGTIAYGINDAGEVVGQFGDNTTIHGFLFDGSTYKTLDAPGAAVTFAVGINSNNLITLQSLNSSGFASSWLLNGTNYILLNVPGAVASGAHSINNLNEIAFSWTDSANATHGAVFAKGKYYFIDDPSGTNTAIDTINDLNVIVGHFIPTGTTQKEGFRGVGRLTSKVGRPSERQ
jgi:hypothetical protein